jgi:taurine transport system ATP-binding protein
LSSGAYISIDNVSVTFGEGDGAVHALDRVSLAFPRGSFVSVVGPSGCGKTTLLNVLAGFETPSHGRVAVDGAEVHGAGADRGVVFQHGALFPWLTVAGNAGFGPFVRGLGRRERAERVNYWLHKVGLWEFRERYPYELSGGMQQRLALARALVNGPAMLLMDEPFGALDALTRERMQEELQVVWRESGMTILFVTHSAEEAVFLGTDVVVMSPRPGRIVEKLAPPFARGNSGRDNRGIKASAAFMALRTRVLNLIFNDAASTAPP